ncbi:MAG: Uncharacterized protein XD72_2272 [Methanothrix harundinacea]|uniref:Type ISP restriction-modification enzyme LLaBIII C-terminal specificity domain-containing protein n=1 Tax=Methanothrix harundinacea TaxID=301375 RepID=A0A101FRY6_9EURY|nr:MAG: Uncharacterized protein XD72_2272 [Methanothrix harundinacea]
MSLAPLYLYPAPTENSSRQKSLSSADWPPGKDGRVPNLSPEFVAEMEERLGLEFVTDGRGDRESTFGPEDVFKSQYFEGVPPQVWEFQVGGYQVCDKWLKDRRGRQLSYDDLTAYQKMIVALKETIRLMEEVDSTVGEWPLE